MRARSRSSGMGEWVEFLAVSEIADQRPRPVPRRVRGRAGQRASEEWGVRTRGGESRIRAFQPSPLLLLATHGPNARSTRESICPRIGHLPWTGRIFPTGRGKYLPLEGQTFSPQERKFAPRGCTCLPPSGVDVRSVGKSSPWQDERSASPLAGHVWRALPPGPKCPFGPERAL